MIYIKTIVLILALYTSVNIIWKMITSLIIESEKVEKIHTYIPCVLWGIFYLLNSLE
jgi:hypothetical protein